MAVKTPKFRLSDEMSGRSAPAKKPARAARPARRPAGPSPYRQGLLLGLCLGMTVALLVGVVAFLVTRPTGAPVAAPPPSAAPAAPSAGPQADIDVSLEHLGDLQLRIEATVSAPTSYDPITRGQVVAYTDMVAMPLSHKQGPIVMAETPGRPGVYEAVAPVAMIGEYNVTVEVKRPMAARATERIDVETVPPGTG